MTESSVLSIGILKMCGFIFGYRIVLDDRFDLDLLKHRGPDYSSTWVKDGTITSVDIVAYLLLILQLLVINHFFLKIKGGFLYTMVKFTISKN